MPQGQPLTVPDDGLTTRARRNAPLLAVHTGQDAEPVQADRDQVDTPQKDRTQSDPGRTS